LFLLAIVQNTCWPVSGSSCGFFFRKFVISTRLMGA